MKFKKWMLLTILCSISPVTFAGWSGAKKITLIYPQATSSTILFKQTSSSSEERQGASGAYYAL